MGVTCFNVNANVDGLAFISVGLCGGKFDPDNNVLNWICSTSGESINSASAFNRSGQRFGVLAVS